MRLIVSNTGPLLHLFETGALDLISLAGDVHIPGAVDVEISYHLTDWHRPTWISLSALQSSHQLDSLAWHQAGLIDWGEAEAIALARQLNADWFLTDDTAARLLARELGLEVHGSLGIVLWAAATGHLTRPETEAALARLAASSLWISARVLAEAQLALRDIFQDSSSSVD